jgi:hypothetical protein
MISIDSEQSTDYFYLPSCSGGDISSFSFSILAMIDPERVASRPSTTHTGVVFYPLDLPL